MRRVIAHLTVGAIDGALVPGVRPVRVRMGGESGSIAGLVLLFIGPRSYTGEDAAELQVPGNLSLVARVLDRALMVEGVRPAAPGEFTARAFLAGKLSAEQAEGVQAAIAARSARDLDAAQSLLSGETGRCFREIADEIGAALALVEAGIDFTDQEDVVVISPLELLFRVGEVCGRIGSLIDARASEEKVSVESVVVLVGAPNSGKSTLFNRLLGRERAVVSAEAGATRDAIEELMELELPLGFDSRREGVRLVDLAGLDEGLAARSALDAAGQAAARGAIGRADVLVLCDPTGRFDAFNGFPTGVPVVRVRTKADLPSAHADPCVGVIPLCAVDGWNVESLRAAIADAARTSRDGESSRVLPRHRRSLRAALDALCEAAELVRRSEDKPHISDAELVAGLLRAALDEIGHVVGRIDPDDVIGRIYATFCIGK